MVLFKKFVEQRKVNQCNENYAKNKYLLNVNKIHDLNKLWHKY